MRFYDPNAQTASTDERGRTARRALTALRNRFPRAARKEPSADAAGYGDDPMLWRRASAEPEALASDESRAATESALRRAARLLMGWR